jgi:hypothetical protein
MNSSPRQALVQRWQGLSIQPEPFLVTTNNLGSRSKDGWGQSGAHFDRSPKQAHTCFITSRAVRRALVAERDVRSRLQQWGAL